MASNQSATRRASASGSARISNWAWDSTFMTLPYNVLHFLAGVSIFGAEHVTFHRLSETFVIVRSRDEPCLLLNFSTGVAHGDADAALSEHQDIIRHIADSGDLGEWYR